MNVTFIKLSIKALLSHPQYINTEAVTFFQQIFLTVYAHRLGRVEKKFPVTRRREKSNKYFSTTPELSLIGACVLHFFNSKNLHCGYLNPIQRSQGHLMPCTFLAFFFFITSRPFIGIFLRLCPKFLRQININKRLNFLCVASAPAKFSIFKVVLPKSSASH